MAVSQRVGAGPLVDREGHGRLAVERAGLVVALGAQLDAAHVAEPDHAPLGVGLEDHLGELLGIGEPAQGRDRELEGLAGGDRRLAELAGRDLDVLLLDRADHVRGGQVAERHLLRVEPDPHAVVALADVGDVADAVEPGQLVAKLDRRVVAQVEVVLGAVGREHVDDHQDAGRLLLHRHAAPLDQVGQDRLGQRLAVLHQHLGHVQIDARLEGHGQDVGAVVGALRRHVHHVLDAVDLLLDRRGHGVGHHLGVGAGVVGRDLDGRRRDLGVLGHRQREERDAPGQRDDDGQHRGEDRPVDEEAREHGNPHLYSASSGSSVLDSGFPCAIGTPCGGPAGTARGKRRRASGPPAGSCPRAAPSGWRRRGTRPCCRSRRRRPASAGRRRRSRRACR